MTEGRNFMDDKLYTAARLEGADIPFSNNTNDDELFLLRSPVDESNVLHVAARYNNQGFILTIMDQYPSIFHELLCKHNSKGQTPLHLAAQFGHLETVRTLLDAHDIDVLLFSDQKKPCWSERDNQGDTPLHWALRSGHEDIAMLLLNRDLQLVSLWNNVGESPAYLAAENVCLKFLHTILEADLHNQCSVCFSGPYGQTVFHPARKLTEDVMSIAIERRRSLLKVQDHKGKTVLHYAVEEKRKSIVEILLKADNSLAWLHDDGGFTPLHKAASIGSLQILETILELSPQSIRIRDKHGKTPLHVAKMEAGFLAGCLKKTRMEELINEVDNDGNTLLHLTLMNSDLESADVILEVRDINWRLKNKHGHNPMDLCKSEDEISNKLKCLALSWKMKEATTRMEKFFTKNVANVDDLLEQFDWDDCLTYRGPNGDSIVHTAVREGHMNIIRRAQESNSSNDHHLLLLEKNYKGETPLHLAAEYGNLQAVKIIISLSISIDQLWNENHDQPLVENGEANQLVRDLKPWRVKSENGDTPAHKAIRNRHFKIALLLLRVGSELTSFINKENESLLYLAAAKRCPFVDFFIMLSYYGRLPYNISGPDGENVLHAAAKTGILRVSSLTKKWPDLINKVDNRGKTPLHHAVEHGQLYIVSHLLSCNKEPAFVYDNEGFTPLLKAAAMGSYLCAQQILKRCPRSTDLRDPIYNRTVLHLAKFSNVKLTKFVKHKNCFSLLNETDKDGNTPLHYAIMNSDIPKALALLKTKGINRRIRNKQHQQPLDLCKEPSSTDNEGQREMYIALERFKRRAPSPFERLASTVELFASLNHDMEAMGEEKLKQILNSIAVAATLLITLTFAAAFTVPGGYDQTTGKLLRIKEVAIQLFIASDVAALLFSVSILLRYTFAVAVGYRTNLGRLAFWSISIIQFALLATMVAFMSGVYANVSHGALWVLIFSVVLAVHMSQFVSLT